MDEETKQNVLTAMEGEAMAYARYTLSAMHARRNGHEELAKLYEETADVELHEHFVELADLVSAFTADEQSLTAAIEGERYETETLYRRFAEQAAAAGEIAAAERFQELAEDERGHLAAFEQQLTALLTHA